MQLLLSSCAVPVNNQAATRASYRSGANLRLATGSPPISIPTPITAALPTDLTRTHVPSLAPGMFDITNNWLFSANKRMIYFMKIPEKATGKRTKMLPLVPAELLGAREEICAFKADEVNDLLVVLTL
jgi:hypothetical protein